MRPKTSRRSDPQLEPFVHFVALLVLPCLVPATLILAQPRLSAADANSNIDPAKLEFFEKKIRPLLAANCYRCHGPEKQEAGLRLDSQSTRLSGGASGPAIVAGQPDKSLLVKALRYDNEDLQMPPDGKLADEEIALLTQWIASGAVAPEDRTPVDTPGIDALRTAARDHWAFQRLKKPTPPIVSNPGASLGPIDRFIAAGWQQVGIEPTAVTDRRTLVRRLYFDLLGLPPTPGEVDAFVAADSTHSVAMLVDELLERPEFGERWGRYWLDMARYADSNGCSLEANSTYDNAWRYRDYVIAAFNEDRPFDRFVLEQVAGDRLPAVSDQQRCR